MKKAFALVLVVFCLTGLSAASTHDDTNAPTDNIPGNQSLPELGDLPGQASDTASQVLGSINEAFQGGVAGLGERLGSALQNLLG